MRRRLSIAAFVLGAALGGQARAQEKPCMADAARLCPNIEPGGGAQLACLKEHKQELSPECKKHVMQAKLKHEEQKQLEQQRQRSPNP